MSQRDEIVASIQKASSFEEQAALVSQLDAYDRERIARRAEADSIDLTDTIVAETLSPVAVHERSTIETDWLGQVESSHEGYANEISAEAALWFQRTSDEVKADGDEFTEQARGMARRTAGKYGEQAQAAEEQFLSYVTFLHKQSASGLPQVQQEVDSFEKPAATPLPEEVFDNFAPPVHPINEGVSGTETSERAPLIAEIEGNQGEQVAPPDPSHHDESQEFAGPTPVEARPGPQGTTSSLFTPTVAMGYMATLDEMTELMAKEAAEKEAASQLDQVQQVVDPMENPKPTPLPEEVAYPWTISEDAQHSKGEANADIEKGAAFQRRAAYVAGLVARPYEDLSEVERKEVLAFTSLLQKRSDQWSQPHQVPGGPVANSPATTPEPPVGSFEEGRAEGASDWPEEAPTYADAASAAPDFVRGHSEGYQDAAEANPVPGAATPGMLPPGAGGMGGYQTHTGSLNTTSGGTQSVSTLTFNVSDGAPPLQVSASFTSPMESADPQFAKGYRYAAKWTRKTALVKQGSVPFEAGLYAGMSDNPDHQDDWVTAHQRAAEKYQDRTYTKRLSLHREFTKKAAQHLTGLTVVGAYLRPVEAEGNHSPCPDHSGQWFNKSTGACSCGDSHKTASLQATAATSADLDTMAPSTSPSPTGSTPINGPGAPGPLAGGEDPARAGGPPPYQGAEPYGQPVVPSMASSHGTPTAIDTTPGGPVDQAAYQHLSPQTMSPATVAFRKTVQANLLKSRQGE